MLAAILASVMSTCSALMLTGSALATGNLYAKLVPRQSERHYLKVGRIASGGVVVVATMMALFHLQNVLDGLKMIWTVYALMGLAWWAGVLWPRATTAAAWVSTLTTVSAYLATRVYNAYPHLRAGGPTLLYQQQIPIYLGCGLIALIVTSYLTVHKDPGRVRRFYRKMRTPTTQPSEFDAEDGCRGACKRRPSRREPRSAKKRAAVSARKRPLRGHGFTPGDRSLIVQPPALSPPSSLNWGSLATNFSGSALNFSMHLSQQK